MPEDRIRPRLLRTAVLPTLVTAVSGAAAVAFTVHSADPEPSTTLWTVLTGTAGLAMASVAAAASGAERMAASLLQRCHALRRATERRQADLRTVVEGLRHGEGGPPPGGPQPDPPHRDELDELAVELGRAHESAVSAVVQAARLSHNIGNEQKLEVFVNLARRLQSLVQREIQLLDDLENEVEDPDLLKGLFQIDHLATRIRRHAENLAVLGGAISRRQWSNPVTMTEVLRSAIAEVEQYPRVKVVPPVEGTLRGHAVADVIHLLAELVENACAFSSPHTQVHLRAQQVTAGIAVEVEDRGLGMPVDEQNRMNALLADPDQVSVARLLQDGRIGLFVVASLARRHGIAVRLQSNIYGGVQAVLVLPQGLIGSEGGGLHPAEASRGADPRTPRTPPVPVPRAPAPEPAAIPRSAPVPQLPRVPEQQPPPGCETAGCETPGCAAPARPGAPGAECRTAGEGTAHGEWGHPEERSRPSVQEPGSAYGVPRTLAPLPVRTGGADRPAREPRAPAPTGGPRPPPPRPGSGPAPPSSPSAPCPTDRDGRSSRPGAARNTSPRNCGRARRERGPGGPAGRAGRSTTPG
ncbi:sensor histidine kinase [Streptomyces clavuligerus]|uniref:sensor histidine kinase n=1 Tax=Streptomyces clavuligerus TaxID=1901 RepID=UPI0027DFF80C|nr:ATP-binding protein [Streptomyces clavuligerus]